VSVLQQGRIVWVRISDPNGQNSKERPAVIVTATDEIRPGEPFVAVAITGTLEHPLPPEYVELPWHPRRHPRTGLKKRCAAACHWLVVVRQEDILEYAGVVPDAKMLAILERIPKPPPGPQGN
jgi:mRNA-degrading endonuclease toxin of MazEF toxin-antitoxin module